MTLKFPHKKRSAISTDDYPMKAAVKNDIGLKLHLRGNTNIPAKDRCSALSFIVHSPLEVPAVFDVDEMIQFLYGYDLDVLITPEIIKTDESLRSISPKERNCFFEGEKKLKYFKLYSRRNCEVECLSDFLKKEFKCTAFYLFRNNSRQVCDHRLDGDVKFETNEVLKFRREKMKCNCLDACNQIKYRTEIISRNVLINESLYSTSEFVDFDYETEIEFKFKDVDVFPLRRYRQMTFSDFLAQSGGMLGLFAGISMLSIIELFYFLSLRWMVSLWRWIVKRFRRFRG
jgi:acid-sensing ion channel, other